MKEYIEEVRAKGHLVDSGIMTAIFDTVIENGGQFEVKEFYMGKTNVDPSRTTVLVKAKKKNDLDKILDKLRQIGCMTKKEQAVLKPAPKDGVVPDNFYSTTNHKTHVKINGEWVLVKDMKMDSVLVVKKNRAICTLMGDVKKNDLVVCGTSGVKVLPEFKERERGVFAFMRQEVSSEKKVEVIVKKIAKVMKKIKRRKGKIVFVVGPVVIHTGGVEPVVRLIKKGYVDALLSGNALAVHDVEYALLGTSLGVDLKTGEQANAGHKNHMVAINNIRRIGSMKKAVKSGILKSGIFYECIKKGVPFVLAGSLRDDGPMPETITDMIEAQRHYRKQLKDAELVIILGTMLHGIATGNMLPSHVKTLCVDINPAVVAKLNDRGTAQAMGIVTDVGLFIASLAKEF